jgi:tetratricopeptide (TPR) repeat protein
LQLGDALYHMGRFAEACEAYAHAIPSTEAAAAPRSYFGYAVSLVNTGRNAEAARVLERLVEATPKDVESLTLLAQMYLEERDWLKARDMLELVVQLAGASADSSLLYNLGFARLQSDLPEPALAAFKEALQLDPNNKQAKAAVRELEFSAKKLTKRLSGPREKQETAQEMLDRIKAMLTAERPAYLLKRKSMEAIRAGYVVAMKGGFDDIAKRHLAKRTHAA